MLYNVILAVAFAFGAFASFGSGVGTLRVAHPEMYAPEDYPLVCGRDYWTYLSAEDLTCGLSTEPLAQLPLFTDSAIVYTAADVAHKDDCPMPRLTDEFGRTKHHLAAIDRRNKPGRPFVIVISNRRNRKTIYAPLPALDIADYKAWKMRHPDFFVFRSTGEIVNDFGKLVRHAPSDSRWAKYKNGDRYVSTKGVEDLYQTEVSLHYGDASACIGFRGFGYSADFIAAANGARAIVGETTGTAGRNGGEWRWNISPMFLRGAGRQFGIPWMWYVALFVNGYRADGTWQNEGWPRMNNPPKGRAATDGGISVSLFRRVNYFAYLAGANALEPEGWNSWGLRRDESGRLALTAYGEAMREIHDFTAAHPDRGLPYCPVAVLVPYNQGYASVGGVPYRSHSGNYHAGDNLVDGVFFTLMPGRDQDAALRRGEEGFLRNSPFAQMYDVMVPDSPQSDDTFLRALSRYPVAILTGEYPDVASLRPKLARYLSAGGTLVVPKALVEAVPTDVGAWDGRVVVSSSEWMTPLFTNDSLADTLAGRLQFPELKSLFTSLENQLFPVRVTGDVLYGLNRAKNHDWIWCINNRGVTQFTDTLEKVDPSASETVVVDLCGREVSTVVELVTGKIVTVKAGKFSFIVPSGGIAIFEVAR